MNEYRLLLTDNAIRNMESIQDYLLENAPDYAQKTFQKILRTIKNICVFPRKGRLTNEILVEDGEVREVFMLPYQIAYLIEGNSIYVLTVYHHKQNIRPMRRQDLFDN